MADFSGREAMASGFKLMGREPLAILAWTVIFVILGLAPQFLMVWIFGPATSAGGLSAARGVSLQVALAASSLLSATVLTGAVFRAVLEPQKRAFFFMRLGVQELWLAAVFVAMAVVILVANAAVTAPMHLASSGAGAPLWAMALMCVGVALLVWLFLRLVLILPMSFAERRFALLDGWRLARGHLGKMFVVLVSLILVVLGAEVVLVSLAYFAVTSLPGLNAFAQEVAADPQGSLTRVPVEVWVAIIGIWALLLTFLRVLFSAVWARIYADLKASGG